METSAFTATPREPVQEYVPADGISGGGVLVLGVVAAIAVLAKRSGRSRPGPAAKTPPQPPTPVGKLPGVSLEELRGTVPVTVPDTTGESVPEEKGMSPLNAPVVKIQAHRLDIPYELARKLQADNWKAMCKARKLSGLERGELERTPYGVAVHVKFNGALDFPTAQRGTDQIETGLDVTAGTVRLRRGATAGRGILDVRIRDPLADGVPWEAPAVPVRLAHPLRLAMTPFGDTVELDLKQRIGVFGTSGSGKSCVQRLIGAHVAQAIDAELEIWDLKFGIESQHYEGKAHRVTTVEDTVDRIEWLLGAEFPRRAAKMRERGVSEWTETPWDPARVIIIDEGNVLVRGFRDWRPERVEGEPTQPGAKPLERLFTAVEQGRALGVYFVWATQFPKAASLPTEIRSQLNATVCLKMRTSEEAAVVFKDDVSDGWCPQDLLGPGWLLVKDDAHTVPVDAKSAWLSVDEFRTVPSSVPDSGPDPDRTEAPVRTAGASLYADGFGLSGTDGQDSGTDEGLSRTDGQDSPGQDSGTGGLSGTGQTAVSLDVWLVLSVSPDSPGQSELSRRTGRSKSAVHAALKKMTDEGSVVQDGVGYRLRTTEEDSG